MEDLIGLPLHGSNKNYSECIVSAVFQALIASNMGKL